MLSIYLMYRSFFFFNLNLYNTKYIDDYSETGNKMFKLIKRRNRSVFTRYIIHFLLEKKKIAWNKNINFLIVTNNKNKFQVTLSQLTFIIVIKMKWHKLLIYFYFENNFVLEKSVAFFMLCFWNNNEWMIRKFTLIIHFFQLSPFVSFRTSICLKFW